MFALVIVAADGTVSVSGPYSTAKSARRTAADIQDYSAGVTADVHEMESARDTRAEFVTSMRTRH